MTVDQEATDYCRKKLYDVCSLTESIKEVQTDYEELLYQLHNLVRSCGQLTTEDRKKVSAEVRDIISDIEFNFSVLGSKFEYIKNEFKRES